MPSKYPNSGTLGKNQRQRPNTKDPGYSGACEIEGVDYWISGWVKDGREGSKFFSLAFKRKDAPKTPAPAPAAPAASATPEAAPYEDEEVPF